MRPREAFEKEGRPAFPHDALRELGDLEIGSDLDANALKFLISLEVVDVTAEVGKKTGAQVRNHVRLGYRSASRPQAIRAASPTEPPADLGGLSMTPLLVRMHHGRTPEIAQDPARCRRRVRRVWLCGSNEVFCSRPPGC